MKFTPFSQLIKNPLSFWPVFVIAAVLVSIAGVGWMLNAIKLYYMLSDASFDLAFAIFRVIGLVVPPIGVILGFL